LAAKSLHAESEQSKVCLYDHYVGRWMAYCHLDQFLFKQPVFRNIVCCAPYVTCGVAQCYDLALIMQCSYWPPAVVANNSNTAAT
jgi:hypothetical protein